MGRASRRRADVKALHERQKTEVFANQLSDYIQQEAEYEDAIREEQEVARRLDRIKARQRELEQKERDAVTKREELARERERLSTRTQATGTATGFTLTSDGSEFFVAPQNFDRNFTALSKGIASSATETDVLGATRKVLSPDGTLQRSFIVKDNPENEENVNRAFGGLFALISAKNQLPEGAEPIKATKFTSYAGSEKFYGKKAKKTFEKLIQAQMGGKVTWNDDTALFEYALDENYVNEQKAKGLDPAGVFEATAFAKARSQSKKFEEEQQTQKEQKEAVERQQDNTKILIGMVALAVDVLRRIFSAVVNWAQNAVRERAESITAHNLGMTYQDYTKGKYLDIAQGLPEGTRNQAIQDIQTSFGDITNLNMKAIEKLAPALSGNILQAINNGLGKQNPEQLYKLFLDSFFQQYREGKNHLNMYVGQDQARKELVTALSQFSPSLAKELATMIDTYTTGKYRGQFTNVSGYESLVNTNPYGISNATINMYKNLAKDVAELESKFRVLGDTLSKTVIVNLAEVIRWFNKLGILETPESVVKSEEKATEWLNKNAGGIEANRAIALENFKIAYQSMTKKPFEESGFTVEQALAGKDVFRKFLRSQSDNPAVEDFASAWAVLKIADEDSALIKKMKKARGEGKKIAGMVNEYVGRDADPSEYALRAEALYQDIADFFGYSQRESVAMLVSQTAMQRDKTKAGSTMEGKIRGGEELTEEETKIMLKTFAKEKNLPEDYTWENVSKALKTKLTQAEQYDVLEAGTDEEKRNAVYENIKKDRIYKHYQKKLGKKSSYIGLFDDSVPYLESEARKADKDVTNNILHKLLMIPLIEATKTKIAKDKTGKYTGDTKYISEFAVDKQGNLTVNIIANKGKTDEEIMASTTAKFDIYSDETLNENLDVTMNITGR